MLGIVLKRVKRRSCVDFRLEVTLVMDVNNTMS